MIIIKTERLTLIPCSMEMLQGLVDEAMDLTAAAGIETAADWPSRDLKDAAPFFIDYLKMNAPMQGKLCWFIVENETNKIMGDLGFKGKPDENGAIEIGYGIAPSRRQNGFAAEAAKALIDWALSQDNIVTVTAQCDDNNVPSVRTLEKIGMKRVKEGDGLSDWEIKGAVK